MADEKKNEQVLTGPYVPVRIKPLEGEEIVLKESELAILVVMDQATGAPVVYNIQHTPLRAFAKALLNEALDLYRLTSTANTTVSILEKRFAEAAAKAGGKKIDLPFDGK